MEERQITLPSVFRYLSQAYIDEFFSSGRLRLSAFSEFAKHPDEQRHDKDEGWATVVIHGKQLEVRSRAGKGRDSYVLSASLKEDPVLMRAFNTDGYFKINDVVGFGIAVASRIVGFVEGTARNCRYVGRKEITREMGAEVDQAFEKDEQGKMDIVKVGGLVGRALPPDVCFLKGGRYAHQQEFRIIWRVSHEVHEPLFVECPEAVQFCERTTRGEPTCS
ncbi:MAG: hypothetical protein JW753_08120 [Dehalococcoidia bacterium]|nr:hypothetical protein [Dehalococcoidia bacterium]